ncbi:HPr family phosphocarrier protein [Acidipropionibacterium jensenii]|uniref:HPr family phosphocarrier protein n=1 Tax=Acidipropionibacterium jensenii TaxID=1749 RepID=UPI00214CB714
MIHVTLRVGHPAGVHARIAAQAVLLASRYSASVFVRTSGGTASLRRLADLLALDINQNETVELVADGPDESAALHSLSAFLRAADDSTEHLNDGEHYE